MWIDVSSLNHPFCVSFDTNTVGLSVSAYSKNAGFVHCYSLLWDGCLWARLEASQPTLCQLRGESSFKPLLLQSAEKQSVLELISVALPVVWQVLGLSSIIGLCCFTHKGWSASSCNALLWLDGFVANAQVQKCYSLENSAKQTALSASKIPYACGWCCHIFSVTITDIVTVFWCFYDDLNTFCLLIQNCTKQWLKEVVQLPLFDVEAE